MTDDLTLALAACLDAAERNERLESYLGQYSQRHAELAELVSLASKVRQAPAVGPSPAFRARARARLIGRLPDRSAPAAARSNSIGAIRPARRLAGLGALAILTLAFLVGAGVIGAANDALPNDALYPVKLAFERLRLNLSGTEAGDGELHLAFAAERLREADRLIAAGRAEEIEPAIDAFVAEQSSARQRLLDASSADGESVALRLEFAGQQAGAASALAAAGRTERASAALDACISELDLVLALTRTRPDPAKLTDWIGQISRSLDRLEAELNALDGLLALDARPALDRARAAIRSIRDWLDAIHDRAPDSTTTPAPSRTPQPTLTPAPTRTQDPTRTPRPSIESTRTATLLPTVKPSDRPTREPTRAPTDRPTRNATEHPTLVETLVETRVVTLHPTERPTIEPTFSATVFPTSEPTRSATARPTPTPNTSSHPTDQPTSQLTLIPGP